MSAPATTETAKPFVPREEGKNTSKRWVFDSMKSARKCIDVGWMKPIDEVKKTGTATFHNGYGNYLGQGNGQIHFALSKKTLDRERDPGQQTNSFHLYYDLTPEDQVQNEDEEDTVEDFHAIVDAFIEAARPQLEKLYPKRKISPHYPLRIRAPDFTSGESTKITNGEGTSGKKKTEFDLEAFSRQPGKFLAKIGRIFVMDGRGSAEGEIKVGLCIDIRTWKYQTNEEKAAEKARYEEEKRRAKESAQVIGDGSVKKKRASADEEPANKKSRKREEEETCSEPEI